jgi:hypothetical protein
VPDHGRTHRAENSNSIPVAELLARPRATSRAGQAPPQGPGPVFVDHLLHREGHGPERRTRQLPRIVGAVAAVAVLSGALMATTQALRPPSDAEPAAESVAAPQHITGSKVFRPDLIRASINEGAKAGAAQPAPDAQRPEAADPARPAPENPAGDPAQPAPGDPAEPGDPGEGGGLTVPTTTAPAPPQVPVPTTRPAPTTTTSSRSGGSGGSGGGLLCGTLPVLDPLVCPLVAPVQSFYEAAPTEPEQAYSLLDSSLQADGVDTFAQSWDGVASATVDSASPDGRNALKVQVTYVRDDGSKVVTLQRLVVRGGDEPKIVEAELLSAVAG